MTTDYNTKQGIKQYLERGLDGLNDLINDRREAFYQKSEKLSEFLVSGRYFMDACGNTGLVFRDDSREEILDLQPRDKVRSKDELKDSYIERLGQGFLPPRSDVVCPICRKGWNLDNCHEAYLVKDVFRHRQCYKISLSMRERESFATIFSAIGIKYFNMIEIENQYWPPNQYDIYPPWFRVEIPGGTFICGYRKNVFSVELGGDWNFPQKFIDEWKEKNITVGKNYFHAWNREQLIHGLIQAFTPVTQK